VFIKNKILTEGNMAKSLVAYFSASGITAKVARNLAEVTGADLYEIKPAQPYTDKDLNWMDQNARSTVEMNDKSFRPPIIKDNPHIEKYDTIFVGFPIWWYVAPTIINTFLEAYDFSNKKIVLFATSGGSGFGGTVDNLRPSVADSTEIIQGKILNHNPSKDVLKEWVESL
jgi:flavodoxin